MAVSAADKLAMIIFTQICCCGKPSRGKYTKAVFRRLQGKYKIKINK